MADFKLFLSSGKEPNALLSSPDISVQRSMNRLVRSPRDRLEPTFGPAETPTMHNTLSLKVETAMVASPAAAT